MIPLLFELLDGLIPFGSPEEDMREGDVSCDGEGDGAPVAAEPDCIL